MGVALYLAFGALAHGNESRVALVIGNSAYPGDAALRNPSNDASALAGRLSQLGFSVTLVLNGGQREMSRAITRFGQRLEGDVEALFFYAGHGVQVEGRNYLIPIDAEISSEPAVTSEGINVEHVLNQMQNARVSIVILDACRNNPFERRFRGASGGLAQLDAPKGTLIAYATAPGRVAEDGSTRTGSHSPYTGAVLDALERPDRPIEEVFKQVRSTVLAQTKDRQIPWESSSLLGSFYFAKPVDPSAGATDVSRSKQVSEDPRQSRRMFCGRTFCEST